MHNAAESLESLAALSPELADVNPDTQPEELVERVLDKNADKRAARRDFLKTAGIAGAGLAAAALMPKAAQAQRGSLDPAILNFALNLEYLEAEFYAYATTGASLESTGVVTTGTNTGAGNPGPISIKASPQMPFTSTDIQAMAVEITADERAHVVFLRTALTAAGVTPVARPALNLLTSFNAAITAATNGAVTTFDPFASDLAFLLGGFIFEDVGVTAYKGASPLLTNKTYLESAAGILGVEAYHAATLRTLLFQQRATVVPGTGGATVAQVVQLISNLRDNGDDAIDNDQGITPDPVSNGVANIVPTDTNAIAYSRTTDAVLRIVYLGGAPGTGGGFFPLAMNGTIR